MPGLGRVSGLEELELELDVQHPPLGGEANS